MNISVTHTINISDIQRKLAETDDFRLDDDEFDRYASHCVANGTRSLEHLFIDRLRNDCRFIGDYGVGVRVGGEALVSPPDACFTIVKFLRWAEQEGLLAMAERGRMLSACGMDPDDLTHHANKPCRGFFALMDAERLRSSSTALAEVA